LGIIAIDTPQGEPLATVWNYAIHGICYDAPNLKFSSDVSGSVDRYVESTLGGVSMFVNGDAGDINPIFPVCCRDGPNFSGGPVIGAKILETRKKLKPSDTVQMWTAAHYVAFGPTDLNLTFARLDNCTRGGPLDICSFCEVMRCDANIHLNSGWVENYPLFNAFRFLINGKNTVAVSIPGEALVELGWEIRNDTLKLGYENTMLFGYANNHMGYFATPDEYDVGGYESILTFWGIGTSHKIREGIYAVASKIAPQSNAPALSASLRRKPESKKL
jgi:hypothetical protein